MYDEDHTRLGPTRHRNCSKYQYSFGSFHEMVIWNSILILSMCRPLGHPNGFLICSLSLTWKVVTNTCIFEFESLITEECITTNMESRSRQRLELM